MPRNHRLLRVAGLCFVLGEILLATLTAAQAQFSREKSAASYFARGSEWHARWELIAVDDPHGFANVNRLVHWRRVMPTINFASGSATVNWDGAASVGADQRAGLVNLLFDVRAASAEARTPNLPLYTFRNKTTGELRQLSDAGQGNITGLWNDLGRFKTPTLRALAARAPYFHNGIASTIEEVVRHYETRLGFIFTREERADLVAFLNAL